MATKQRDSFGPRRRFKGKMVLPNGQPRSTMASSKLPGKTNKLCKASVGLTKNPVYESRQPGPRPTKVAGPYKVTMPRKNVRFGGEAHAISA